SRILFDLALERGHLFSRLLQIALQLPLAPKRPRPSARAHPHPVLRHPLQLHRPPPPSSSPPHRSTNHRAPHHDRPESPTACGNSPAPRRRSSGRRRGLASAAPSHAHYPPLPASRTATAHTESPAQSPSAPPRLPRL